MESNINLSNESYKSKIQSVLDIFSQCKIDYLHDKEECKKIKEANSKLELELTEIQKLEKSHRSHLLSTREMIGNLQETVSQLVYLKRDAQKLKEDIQSKDSTISVIMKEKENLTQRHNDIITEIKNAHERRLEEMSVIYEKKMQQAQQEADTKVAQFQCLIEEMRVKIEDMESDHRDKLNAVVLEYEEKLQRNAAEVTQLRNQNVSLVSRTEVNIDAYRRRLQELEEKLKLSQFKNYLAQTNMSYDKASQEVERPYSVNRALEDPVREHPKPGPLRTQTNAQNKAANRRISPLRVNYYDNPDTGQSNNVKRGPFSIAKKRKLYNEKDYQDF